MQPAHVIGTYSSADPDEGDRYWWIPLLTGSLWTLFALVVFRFDYTTVAALSVLVGTFCFAASALEGIAAANAHGWWRAAHIALVVVFLVIGAVAYAHPGDTVAALASVFAFYLLARGIFDIVVALFVRGTELWWTGLVSGVAQVLLAFWAAGDFGHKAILLVVWVGASALAHGLVQIVTAFRLRPGHGSGARLA